LRIRRARLHNAVADDRDRLALCLNAVSPTGLGVPDGGLLYVPRLVARTPLSRHGDGGVFARHVADGLREALRQARRPGEAHSPGDSLLFENELDAAVGVIGQWLAGAPPVEREWWPYVTDGAPPSLWWRRAILPDGRRLPSIIASLARRGVAELWLGRLDPGEIRTGLAAIEEAHGLSLPRPRQERFPNRLRDPTKPASKDLDQAAALVEAIAPEARRANLAPPARLLLLVALIADRRPAMLTVQSAALAFAGVAAGRLPAPDQRADPSRPRAPAASPSETPGSAGPIRTWPLDRAPSQVPLPAAGPGPTNAIAVLGDPGHRAPPRPAVPTPAERPVKALAPRPLPKPPCPPAAIHSEYGGLLFLLNALLALGVYGDFSEPRRSVPGLSPSGMLRHLGRAWFGAPFVADPLHGLLTRLAGGPSADRALDFEAQRWSVPRTWLLPWPHAGPALVAGGKRRPMLWHRAGFPLAELDGCDPGAAIRAARRLGLRGRPRSARFPRLPAPPRARWLACLRLYLEARLVQALGLDNGMEAVTELCRRPADICVDGDRVQAQFVLNEHSIAIRLAGLDRDPGWIPSARYDFRYMFE
jgi:hypothetical protein